MLGSGIIWPGNIIPATNLATSLKEKINEFAFHFSKLYRIVAEELSYWNMSPGWARWCSVKWKDIATRKGGSHWPTQLYYCFLSAIIIDSNIFPVTDIRLRGQSFSVFFPLSLYNGVLIFASIHKHHSRIYRICKMITRASIISPPALKL